ncbi:hypothetical protein ES703_64698 [subsurface metagenome]
MDTPFIFQPTKSTVTFYFKDDFFKTAYTALVGVNNVYFPTFRLSIPTIHAEKVGGKQPGFVTTSPGSNFHNDVSFIIIILGQKGKF